MKTTVALSFVVIPVAILLRVCKINGAEQCINGTFHKKSPGSENKDYVECHPWQNKTCCTADFTKEFKANRTRKLYNHDWHRCSKLSSTCERFWMNQECFYQCSPYIYKWKAKEKNMDIIQGVPICASVCDRWYDACKYDQICVENVLVDYNFTEHGENFCPKDKPCVTYEKMYGSGKALCEKMWGGSYVYTVENSRSSNCMVMWFNGDNPNKYVQIDKSTYANGHKSTASVYIILLSFLLYRYVL